MLIPGLALLWLTVGESHGIDPDVPWPRPRPIISSIEKDYEERTGLPLRLFGHRQFHTSSRFGRGIDARLPGQIDGNYQLGVGDELTITLTGPASLSANVTVDAEGRLALPQMAPTMAAGRSLEDVRAEIRARLAERFRGSKGFVSLSALRHRPILITGAVSAPGFHALTAFDGVLEALLAAGGITKSGSLRAISVIRAGTGHRETVDLYGLLLTDLDPVLPKLSDGDRILVPPIGPTIAVAGHVQRPGIFELPPSHAGIPSHDAVRLAGGPIRPGPLRGVRQSIDADGRDRSAAIAPLSVRLIEAGSILWVRPAQDAQTNTVTVLGHVHRPGPRPLDHGVTPEVLLPPGSMGPSPYLHFAILDRRETADRRRALRATALPPVHDGGPSPVWPLEDGDRLIVLGTDDVDFLSSRSVLAVLRGAPPTEATCAALGVLARELTAFPDGPLAAGPLADAARSLTGPDRDCPSVFAEHPDTLAFALHHAVFVRDGRPRAGFYPVADPDAARHLYATMTSGTGSGTNPFFRPTSTADGVWSIDTNLFSLLGHVHNPGTRPLRPGLSLRQALRAGAALRRGAYPLFGLIVRLDRQRWIDRIVPFSPRAVLGQHVEHRLHPGDRVHVFETSALRRALMASRGLSQSKPDDVTIEEMRTRLNVASPKLVDDATWHALDRWAATVPSPESAWAGRSDADSKIPGDLLAVASDHGVLVTGEVRNPGRYPIVGATDLATVVETAGGLTADADPSAIEIVPVDRRRPGPVPLQAVAWSDYSHLRPGDSIRVPPRFRQATEATVRVEGEVRYPGVYPLRRSDTLLSVLQRAGGLTDQAYPAGAVVTRVSERRQQQRRFAQAAAELERLLIHGHSDGAPLEAAQAAQLRALVADLRSVAPVGRITVEADPAVLRARPHRDTLLHDGDRIVIPRHAALISVVGEVLSPSTLPFVSGQSPRRYVRDAGGLTRHADDDRIYVLLPDGSAQPVMDHPWDGTSLPVPPGSTIVVPRDPEPFDILDLTQSIAGLLGQLALTAASLKVLGE